VIDTYYPKVVDPVNKYVMLVARYELSLADCDGCDDWAVYETRNQLDDLWWSMTLAEMVEAKRILDNG
jgi:hypothetical protein